MGGELGRGLDGAALQRLSAQICDVRAMGVEVAVVVGGGNFIRGSAAVLPGVDRVQADIMGMLATIINALAFKSCLESSGVASHVQSAMPIMGLAPPFDRAEALSRLKQGDPVIFAGGTGQPFFTTDTTAVLRAVQIEAQAVLKGTKVDGVYSADPVIDPRATKYDRISFLEVLEKGLKVIDSTAAALCMDHNLPLIIFNVQKKGNLRRIMSGDAVGTVVKGEGYDQRKF